MYNSWTWEVGPLSFCKNHNRLYQGHQALQTLAVLSGRDQVFHKVGGDKIRGFPAFRRVLLDALHRRIGGRKHGIHCRRLQIPADRHAVPKPRYKPPALQEIMR